jgi:enoyl-[acyl-carrier protein] reductase II
MTTPLDDPLDMPHTRVSRLFGIRYPIVQAGMIWVSGAKLAAAVSNAGGLGLIGAGSMKPDLLREHIRKARALTDKPFGVNIPLLREDAGDLVNAAIEQGVRVLFTSAGHPGKFIDHCKGAGCTVAHVVSTVRQARKAESAGCDAVVAEGFEAGGHNGPDEITTLCLVPQVVDAVSIPVLAAGGIMDGRGMLAVFALGASGVQIGTLFAATEESSAHAVFKELIVSSSDASTILTMKKIAPVRLLKTPFALRALEAESSGASVEELKQLLSTKRERSGMFEGNLDEGEFEAGQGAAMVYAVRPAGDVVRSLVESYRGARKRLAG